MGVVFVAGIVECGGDLDSEREDTSDDLSGGCCYRENGMWKIEMDRPQLYGSASPGGDGSGCWKVDAGGNR